MNPRDGVRNPAGFQRSQTPAQIGFKNQGLTSEGLVARTIDTRAIRKFSVSARLKLIAQIEETIDEDMPVTDQQLTEIKRRLEWARVHPDECLTHKQFKAKMRKLMK